MSSSIFQALSSETKAGHFRVECPIVNKVRLLIVITFRLAGDSSDPDNCRCRRHPAPNDQVSVTWHFGSFAELTGQPLGFPEFGKD